ncbi:hypothetical protein F5880DRAFT_1680583 [Lentinula raphanica]|nr:hypothetical protein F5880DRAFT_1680583 [Lentinula raphanica]
MSDQRPPGRTMNHGVLGGKRPRRRVFEDMHDDELTYHDAFSSDVPNAQYVRVDPIPTHSPNFTCSNADISGGMMSAVGGSQHISEDHHHHDTCNHIGVQNVYNYNYTIIDYKAAFIIPDKLITLAISPRLAVYLGKMYRNLRACVWFHSELGGHPDNESHSVQWLFGNAVASL